MANLRRIAITECILDRDAFRKLIGKFPRLEEFKYHSEHPRRLPGLGLNDITASKLTKELYKRRATLKRIDIDQSWRIKLGNQLQPFYCDDILRSLLEFPVLEHLSVNSADIFPVPGPNGEPDGQGEDDQDDGQGPRLNDREQWLVELVPPSLKALKVMGSCPYSQCVGLSDAKRFGEGGDNLKRVVFGDVKPSGELWEPLTKAEMREGIVGHFREKAGIECEVGAGHDEQTFDDWFFDPPSNEESEEAEDNESELRRLEAMLHDREDEEMDEYVKEEVARDSNDDARVLLSRWRAYARGG